MFITGLHLFMLVADFLAFFFFVLIQFNGLLSIAASDALLNKHSNMIERSKHDKHEHDKTSSTAVTAVFLFCVYYLLVLYKFYILWVCLSVRQWSVLQKGPEVPI